MLPGLEPLARRLGPLVEAVSDRMNPILVKEVRQALRGRYFSVVFTIMVAIATVIGCMILVTQGYEPKDDAGVWFFVSIYGCLGAAVHVFVPFGVFLSVGSEWEENTYDLLVLSNLRPYQIVFGKLLSAGVQVLLFYSAFGPYLVFAFLLRGLDLGSAAWMLGLTLVTSFTLCSIALALSSLVQHRFGRVVVMAALAVVLVWSEAMSLFVAVQAVEERFVHTPEFWQVAGAGITTALTISAYACALAATRFAHSEENRSTPLRVLTVGTVVACIAWMGFLYYYNGFHEILAILGTMLLVGSFAMSILFCAEEESLGRRVRTQVPAGGLRSLLAAPFLPGGGRGVLLHLLNGGLVALALWLLPVLVPGPRPASDRWMLVPAGVFLYGSAYLLVVTGVMSRWTHRLKFRVLARCYVILGGLLCFVVPTVAGLLVRHDDWMRGRHLGNPVWTIDEAYDGYPNRGFTTVAVLAGLALLLNLPRIRRGFVELGECRREGRKRARAARSARGAMDAGGASDAESAA